MASERNLSLPTLNLLLKQQILRQVSKHEFHEEIDRQHGSCVKISTSTESTRQKIHSEMIFSDEPAENDENQHTEIKLALARIQLEESNLNEKYKTLTEQYDLIELLLEHTLQHIECLLLTFRSTSRISNTLDKYIMAQQFSSDILKESVSILNKTRNYGLLKEIKGKLFAALQRHEHINQLRDEYTIRKKNYDLAMKNFKIILEVMRINENTCKKLKSQLDDVLMSYQNCHSILEEELPIIIVEKTKVLFDCFQLFQKDVQLWSEQTVEFSKLIKNLIAQLKLCEHIKETSCTDMHLAEC